MVSNVKEDKQEKIKEKKSNVTSKRINMDVFKKLYSKEQYYNKFASTKYTTDEKVNNLFIAYKWLMELNGVVVGNDLQSDQSKKECLNKINKLAFEEKRLLHTESIKTDVHYMYLKTKLESQVISLICLTYFFTILK